MKITIKDISENTSFEVFSVKTVSTTVTKLIAY